MKIRLPRKTKKMLYSNGVWKRPMYKRFRRFKRWTLRNAGIEVRL